MTKQSDREAFLCPDDVFEKAIMAYAKSNEAGSCPDNCIAMASEAVWQAAKAYYETREVSGDKLDLATVIANVAQAYGILHGTLTDNPNVHEARKLLFRCLSKEGQKIGIMHANENGKNQFNEASLSALQPQPPQKVMSDEEMVSILVSQCHFTHNMSKSAIKALREAGWLKGGE